MLLVRLQKKKTWESLDCKTVVFFFSKSVEKSVKRAVRVLRAQSARVSFSVSPQVSLSVFSLVPDLLFDCSRVHEYAKIRTVLQSRESFVFLHCKTTTFYPHFTSSFIHDPPTVYSLSWSTAHDNLPASKLSFWWTREKSRESRTRKETWVRGWRARSQATRQWDTSSLLGQFSFVLLNPIVFIYLRNLLTSLVLSFPLTSSFFYIIFLEQIVTFMCLHRQKRLLNRKEKITQQGYRCDWLSFVLSYVQTEFRKKSIMYLQWAPGLSKALQIFGSIQLHVKDCYLVILLRSSFFTYLPFHIWLYYCHEFNFSLSGPLFILHPFLKKSCLFQ